MKQEQQLLYKVMRHFEGMQKIEVFDILHKIEILLFHTKSPIKRDGIAQIISSEIDRNQDVDPLQFTILPNGNFCEFIGSNNWIHIYKEQKRWILNQSLFDTYYFKTKYAPLELSKLTKRNLLDYMQDTQEEHKVKQFLQSHRIAKKDMVTNKLLLLNL